MMTRDLAPAIRLKAPVYDWSASGSGIWRTGEPTWASTARITAIRAEHDPLAAAAQALASARSIVAGLSSSGGLIALEVSLTGGTESGLIIHLRCHASRSAQVAESCLRAIVASLPPTLHARADHEPAPFTAPDPAVIELRRRIHVESPAHPASARHYRVADIRTPAGISGDGTGWHDLHAAFARATAPVQLSIVLKPTMLTPDELEAADRYTAALTSLGHDHQTHDMLGFVRTVKADAAAAASSVRWRTHLEALRHASLLARIVVRGEASAVHALTPVAVSALAADQSRTLQPLTPSAPVSIEARGMLWESVDALDLYPLPTDAGDTPPAGFDRLPYLYSLDEAASILALPVADPDGAPGLMPMRKVDERRSDPLPHDARRRVVIGRLLNRGELGTECSLMLDDLSSHVLAVGATGAGKSTSVAALISQAWHEYRIPFLVVEPSKPEYASLLGGIDGMRVLRIGGEHDGLRLNPLAALPGESRHARHSRIHATLVMALPLAHPLPELLSIVIDRMLDRPDADRATLGMLRHEFMAYFETLGLRGEAQNIGAAFEYRLRSLCSGVIGTVLDTCESTPIDDLFGHPTIIELDQVTSDDHARLLVAVVLGRLRATAVARGLVTELQHLTVLEEAHRLLGRPASAAGGDDGDRFIADSTRSFSQQIAELRGFGEGFIIATQSPATLVPEVIANTGTRLAHRLTLEEDAVAMAPPGADRDRIIESIVRLKPGETMLTTRQHPTTIAVQVTPAAPAIAAAPTAPATAEHLRPYALCGSEACPSGCSAEVRAGARLPSRQLADSLAAELRGGRRKIPLSHAARIVIAEVPGGSPRTHYCIVAHLHATTVIGATPSTADTREWLWQSIQNPGHHESGEPHA